MQLNLNLAPLVREMEKCMEKNEIVGYEPLVKDLKQLIQKKQYQAAEDVLLPLINNCPKAKNFYTLTLFLSGQIEKANHITITEEQVIDRLSKLANGNILDTVYRRTLIRIFVNKIFIYDDKITITFKIGDEEVEITKELLDKIEGGLGNETLCFSEATVHQIKIPHRKVWDFYLTIPTESKGRPSEAR